MVRFKIHRGERGVWMHICSAVLYIKDAGVWRLATKAEGDVWEIQLNGMSVDAMPFLTSAAIPASNIGTDGDYYALLYPLAQDGGIWDGEVWSAEGSR